MNIWCKVFLLWTRNWVLIKCFWETDLRKSADISKLMTHGKNWCQIFLDIFSCSLIPSKFINVAYEIRKNRRGSIPILLMDPKEILTLPVPIPEEERKLTFILKVFIILKCLQKTFWGTQKSMTIKAYGNFIPIQLFKMHRGVEG